MRAPSTLSKGEWPPNYTDVFMWRQRQLARMKADPELIYGALEYYKRRPVEWINHWVDTYDPRNAFAEELPTRLPFVLFERQAKFVEFIYGCLADQQDGLGDKSRDMGATWIAVAASVHLWRFYDGAAIGWGSRKKELVDHIGDPKSIFEKIRQLIRGLPKFFMPVGFEFEKHVSEMRVINPQSGASITGEVGDNIGRGGRTLIYFKDESAHYEHPESIEAALGDNTNVQIDISTVNGVGTVFDRKRVAGVEWEAGTPPPPNGTVRVFTLDWSHHPAKSQEWHDTREKKARDAGLLAVFRQEVDRDAAASLSGIIIKPEWVRAAVDAHVELRFGDVGGWSCGFDPYDEGGDLHARSFRKGVVLYDVDDWGEGDTGEATRKVIGDTLGRTPITIQYDCVGIGAGVKAEANRLKKEHKLPINVTFAPWDAGDGPVKPEERVIPGDASTPLNKDFYANMKAQGWWNLARRFERVYRMKVEGIRFSPDQLISISSKIPKLEQLKRELSQAVMVKSGDLRLLVDKKPEGAKSPNMADCVMMNYFPVKLPMIIAQSAVQASAR